jgi:hypothetical protein
MNTLFQSIPTSAGVRKVGLGEGEKFDIAGFEDFLEGLWNSVWWIGPEWKGNTR